MRSIPSGGGGRGRRLRTERAFTLIEAVVWCAILSAVCAIGAQTFEGMGATFRSRRAVLEVAALLEWVRWETIRQGCVHLVEFDSAGARVDVYRETDEKGGHGASEAIRHLDLGEMFPGVVFGVARGTQRTNGCALADRSGIQLRDHLIKFYPTGTVDRCGSIYMMPEADLRDRKDRMHALSILLSTGRLQLWKYDPWAESDCSDNGGWVEQY